MNKKLFVYISSLLCLSLGVYQVSNAMDQVDGATVKPGLVQLNPEKHQAGSVSANPHAVVPAKPKLTAIHYAPPGRNPWTEYCDEDGTVVRWEVSILDGYGMLDSTYTSENAHNDGVRSVVPRQGCFYQTN